MSLHRYDVYLMRMCKSHVYVLATRAVRIEMFHIGKHYINLSLKTILNIQCRTDHEEKQSFAKVAIRGLIAVASFIAF